MRYWRQTLQNILCGILLFITILPHLHLLSIGTKKFFPIVLFILYLTWVFFKIIPLQHSNDSYAGENIKIQPDFHFQATLIKDGVLLEWKKLSSTNEKKDRQYALYRTSAVNYPIIDTVPSMKPLMTFSEDLGETRVYQDTFTTYTDTAVPSGTSYYFICEQSISHFPRLDAQCSLSIGIFHPAFSLEDYSSLIIVLVFFPGFFILLSWLSKTYPQLADEGSILSMIIGAILSTVIWLTFGGWSPRQIIDIHNAAITIQAFLIPLVFFSFIAFFNRYVHQLHFWKKVLFIILACVAIFGVCLISNGLIYSFGGSTTFPVNISPVTLIIPGLIALLFVLRTHKKILVFLLSFFFLIYVALGIFHKWVVSGALGEAIESVAFLNFLIVSVLVILYIRIHLFPVQDESYSPITRSLLWGFAFLIWSAFLIVFFLLHFIFFPITFI